MESLEAYHESCAGDEEKRNTQFFMPP